MNSHLMKSVILIGLAALALVGSSAPKQQAAITWTPERDPEIRRLLKERRDEAAAAHRIAAARWNAGTGTAEETRIVAQMVVDSELGLAESPGQLIAVRERYLEVTKQDEADAERRYQAGTIPKLYVSMTRCWRLGAEIELVRAKRDFQMQR